MRDLCRVPIAPVLLITPPFTQLNTPYPATAYLKGFLATRGVKSVQADLGIEVTLALFTKATLGAAFDRIDRNREWSQNAQRIIRIQQDYRQTVDPVIRFLQGKDVTLAHRIGRRGFLPEASRFAQLGDLQDVFGSMGTTDKAKHLATLYLEDIADLIAECLDPHFGFSRYAERLARSAASFDGLYAALNAPPTFIDELLFRILKEKLESVKPALVAISVPFPGNLYAALRCGQYIRAHHPDVSVANGWRLSQYRAARAF